MLTITSNEQANSLVKNGVLAVYDDIEIAFDGFSIKADIKCKNICSKGKPRGINARAIKAWNINTKDIYAWDINAWDINAENINAMGISAENIDAKKINYRTICAAYENIICTSIVGNSKNARHFCTGGKITIKQGELKC